MFTGHNVNKLGRNGQKKKEELEIHNISEVLNILLYSIWIKEEIIMELRQEPLGRQVGKGKKGKRKDDRGPYSISS